MKKFGLILFGFALGVIVTFPFVPDISFEEHTVDLPFRQQLAQEAVQTYVVTHVVDGDTVDVTSADGVKQRVRFVGIDTPETVDPRKQVECEGHEASQRMKALLHGKTVTLERKPDEDTDQYGRALRYVFLDGEDIGARMISEGYAESICDRYPHPKCALYDQMEAAAKNAGKGRWLTCANIRSTPTP